MNKMLLLALLVLTGTLSTLQAQNLRTFSGLVIASDSEDPLLGASVLLTSLSDSTFVEGSSTDVDGKFLFSRLRPGMYRIRVSYIGYKVLAQDVDLQSADQALGALRMEIDATVLDGVTVTERMIRVEQLDDTTQYNAEAYKVNPDASAEDLVTKMPGIVLEGGQIKAQGEEVRRVTVDGKEYFGEDATLALKSIPAEVVSKIQVYDQMSDQSQFTGFDDGNSTKAINIVTKSGISNGQFGRLYAGYGTENRYLTGGNVNVFDGDRRISIIGMANNVNQQNFSSEDLTSATGSAGGRRWGRGSGGVGNANDFITGQQGGITETQSVGINYADKLGEKVKVAASYFYNRTDNERQADILREFFLDEGVSQFYEEGSIDQALNNNHRFNMRFEYTIDSSNSFIYTPRLRFQNRDAGSVWNSLTFFDNETLLNQSEAQNSDISNNYAFSNSLLYRRKLAKRGRTISLDLRTDHNRGMGSSALYSLNEFFDAPDPTLLLDQIGDNDSDRQSYEANLSYTEPIGAKGQLQIDYQPSISNSYSGRTTLAFDPLSELYNRVDSILSNEFENEVFKQQLGVSYRLRGKKTMFSLGLEGQQERLLSEQLFPLNNEVRQDFYNLLPNAMFTYTPSKTKNLRMFYRTRTNTPSIGQLQNVIDNSNPLQLSGGNPELQQEVRHFVISRYSITNPEKANTFYAFLFAGITENYISSSSFIAQSDTLLQNNISLLRGSQFRQPVNLSGYWNGRGFLSYGFPVPFIKSNLNLNAGFNYARTPSLINEALNIGHNYGLNSSVVLGSNISQNIDFTLSFSGNYSIVNYTIQPQLNNNFFYQTTSLRFNWLFGNGFVLSSDANYFSYLGLGEAFNQQFILWNGGFGYKFLKNKAGELRLNVFDILNQNNSISREINPAYIEDSETRVLNRYFLLSFNYTIRNFQTSRNVPTPRGRGAREER